jgi:hypothetical protein
MEDAFAQTTLGKSSQKQYANKITQWLSYTAYHTIDELLEHPAEATATLYAVKTIAQTPTNRHVYLSAVVAYLTHVVKATPQTMEPWKDLQKTNWEPLADHYAQNEPTEKQKDKVMEPAKMEEIRQSLKRGSLERLLLTFYTKMEPVRADYYATEIIRTGEESKEENYITLDTRKLVVRDFKTKQSHKAIENTLPEEVAEELEQSLQLYPRSYVFVMEDKKTPFTRKLFSNWACRTLTRVLQQPMTLTVLRHLYITEKIQTQTQEERKEMAKKMGHSRGMQTAYAWSA